MTDRGFDVAFLGSKGERDVVTEILEDTALASSAERLNLCGAMSLQQTAAFISRSRLLICNDSGLMHVAAAMGAPILALFGPTEYDRTRPFTERCVVLRGPCHCNAGTLFDRKTLKKIMECDRICLQSIRPSAALAEVLRLMSQEPTGRAIASRR